MKSWLELYEYFPDLIIKYGKLLQDDECDVTFTIRKSKGSVVLAAMNVIEGTQDVDNRLIGE